MKESSKFIIILLLGLAIGLVIGFLSFHHRNVTPVEYSNSKIDSLNSVIDSLNGCILNISSKIDTIYQTKTKIKYIYREKADTIWNQSAAADWDYYTKFLRTKFSADSNSTKTN